MHIQSEQAAGGTSLSGPPPYDICTPGILPVDQIGLVEAIHRKFLQSLARRLGDWLQTAVDTDLAAIEQTQFSDFLNSCDGDACLIWLDTKPSVGPAILELSPGFVHRVLSILIGAPENSARPERGITGIERHILRECFDTIVLQLKEAWAGRRVAFEPMAVAPGEEQAQPALGGSAVVIGSLLSLGGDRESIRLAIPALLVRLAVTGMSAAAAPPQAASRPLVLEAMRAAAVRVEAVLGGSSLRMRDLLTLQPGQILTLGPPANCSVECIVNGVSKFQGELVSSGRNQAFQIGSPIETRTAPRD
jgi:flagellar motor switch protein FliM